MRKFTTAGPVRPDRHYCIDPLQRVDLEEFLELIDDLAYFVLHAPRQSGKTSVLKALDSHLNTGGTYRCVYVNVECGQAAREDTGRALRAILGHLSSRARLTLRDEFVASTKQEILEEFGPDGALIEMLIRWTQADSKPLVLLIDEIDALVGDTLISVLRQLGTGYDLRGADFPHAVILCGVRNVRDYGVYSTTDRNYTSGGSAFNIKAESLRLADFSEGEVLALLTQHTEATGQVFEDRALERVWRLTQGQPWLVNALALQACFKEPSGRDRSRTITAAAIDNAMDALIEKRVTHLHYLAAQLSEDRVRRVIEPMLADSEAVLDLPEDDLNYVCDLGLVRDEGEPRIANPIYREVIPHQLTYGAQRTIVRRARSFVDSAGRLDLEKLIRNFQAYFRQHSEAWGMRVNYKEASAQLLLHAFLEKIVNGTGRIEREYGMGRGRTDLLVKWPQGGSLGSERVSKHLVECKGLRTGRSLKAIIRQGVSQTAWYMDRCGAESGHLLIFDQRPEKKWDERLFRREEHAEGTPVTVWGM